MGKFSQTLNVSQFVLDHSSLTELGITSQMPPITEFSVVKCPDVTHLCLEVGSGSYTLVNKGQTTHK